MFKQPPTAYVVPALGYPDGKNFFRAWPLWNAIRDRLRTHGVRLQCRKLRHIPRGAPLTVFINTSPSDQLDGRPPKNLLLIQWEPAAVLPYQHTPTCLAHFGHILTLRDNLAGATKFSTPHPLEQRPSSPTRLITMVVGNKASSHPKELYTERRRLIEFFEDKPEADFTFYGGGWEHLGYRTYGGPVADKLETLSNFHFTIAYENCHSLPGYVTEKILDCFCAGSVPIYWGAPNITDYIPADCFVDRTRFPSDQALYDYLLTADPAPYLAAAQRFLCSKKAKIFSEECFVGQMTADIREAVLES